MLFLLYFNLFYLVIKNATRFSFFINIILFQLTIILFSILFYFFLFIILGISF